MRRISGFCLALLFVLALPLAVMAREEVLTYHSDIVVEPDGAFTVTETIRVNAEGIDIRRGIFRDFPLRTRTQSGRLIRAGFELLSVTRDGRPEASHTQNISGGIRIYAGAQETQLSPGAHTYTITYRTDRWILRYEDQDEVYWNVNGTGWQFPIRKVSATVHLPGETAPTQVDYFTGGYGAEGKDARSRVTGNQAFFETTRPFAAEENLTVIVGMPKGVIPEPTASETFWQFVADSAGWLIGALGVVIVGGYYWWAWSAFGRDPERGVVVPRWDAPDGLSPALVNYVENKGFSGGGWTAFSATLLHLAVGGYVELDDLASDIVVRRTEKPAPSNLPSGQKAILAAVGKAGEELAISKANGTEVERIGNRFRNAIEKEHRGKYYQGNATYIVTGIFLSLAVLVPLFIFGNFTEDTVAMMIAPIFLTVIVSIFAAVAGRGLRRGAPLRQRIVSVIVLGFVSFAAITAVGSGLLLMVGELLHGGDIGGPVCVAALFLINLMFFFLMGAPTPLGAKLMDGIEGLRLYLTVAEEDRMNMAGAPTMSPQHFEKLLPYAVALGVEKPWSHAFENWLAAAGVGAAAGLAASYSPDWYHGGSMGDLSGRISEFSSSMASTLSSSIPEAKSSSGGGGGFSSGGGFSGGGGGGGGGGGW